MKNRDHADVVIVGGAIIGSAVATFLALRPDFDGRIVVVERDPSFRTSSTTLSAASIRLQFSTPLNIEISRFGIDLIKHPDRYLAVDGEAPDVDFVENGYLFLATRGRTRDAGAQPRGPARARRSGSAPVAFGAARPLRLAPYR